MTEIILRNGGLVSKFLGDGLMAVFGFPAWKEEMFANAFAACREMLSAEETLAGKENGVGDRVGVGIGDGVGVGIAWGIVIAGIVGNQERQEYTVMGAPVNLASRLEKLAGPGEIVFPFEPGQTDRVIPFGEESYTLEQVHIKGMKQPITVGRIKGRG
jgi:adenylate cyclase